MGVDFSAEMCRRARRHVHDGAGPRLHILERDILDSGLGDDSADVIVSSFGLKTFSEAQRAHLAAEVARVLRPGGVFSFIEISVPPGRLLRGPYLFYLKHVIPHVGRLFLGDPAAYRMLGAYTEAFGDCQGMTTLLQLAGLDARFRRLFFGCASGIVCTKPATGA